MNDHYGSEWMEGERWTHQPVSQYKMRKIKLRNGKMRSTWAGASLYRQRRASVRLLPGIEAETRPYYCACGNVVGT
jgi:hypothetical protein